jgi:hypothetical protein
MPIYRITRSGGLVPILTEHALEACDKYGVVSVTVVARK